MPASKPKPFGFPKAAHLRRPSDFRRVFERRRSISNPCLLIYACENDLGFLRLGLSVSRKFGGAVQRNRLRRLFREAFRLSRHQLPYSLDVVLIPRSRDEPDLKDLISALMDLVPQLAKKMGKKIV